jgi:hypothetical protein
MIGPIFVNLYRSAERMEEQQRKFRNEMSRELLIA